MRKTLITSGGRERIEDALKHMCRFERKGLTATAESVGGALECGRGEARGVLAELREKGLCAGSGGGFRLTDSGRSEALRILRAHRLYETYLADETGETGRAWHTHAERMEHELSAEEIDALADRLGHPRYDPHGDPIPTRGGESPAPRGMPLTALEVGTQGRVVRLDDESEGVIDRLCQAGIAPNLPFELVSAHGDGRTLLIAGREIVCDAAMANAMTVERLPEGEGAPRDLIRLTDLRHGQSAEIAAISPACRGSERRRLMDLGIVGGGRIETELSGVFRSPVGYRIRNTLVALRKAQTDNIFVRKITEDKAEMAL